MNADDRQRLESALLDWEIVIADAVAEIDAAVARLRDAVRKRDELLKRLRA